MVILEIESVNQFNNYTLKDKKNNKSYNLYMEFYGIQKPVNGSSIALNEFLLNPNYEGYSQPYAFKLCENENSLNLNDTEKIALKTNTNKYILKRLYG